MRILTLFAGLAAVAACPAGAAADPSRLLAPDDPAYHSGWRPPPSPTVGLKTYRPIAAKDWLELNKGVGGAMDAMPGMRHGR